MQFMEIIFLYARQFRKFQLINILTDNILYKVLKNCLQVFQNNFLKKNMYFL